MARHKKDPSTPGNRPFVWKSCWSAHY